MLNRALVPVHFIPRYTEILFSKFHCILDQLNVTKGVKLKIIALGDILQIKKSSFSVLFILILKTNKQGSLVHYGRYQEYQVGYCLTEPTKTIAWALII